MKNIIFGLFFFSNICAFSQISENFSDGKFCGTASAPRQVEWAGDVEKFIVNSDLQLQLNASGLASPAQLRTASSISANGYWEFWLKMGFNPTNQNYAKIFIISDEDDLAGDLNGLFIRVGYTNKNVSLVQQKAGSTNKVLIEGTTKRLDLSTVAVQVKLTLDRSGKCTLYSRLDGESDYTEEGSCQIAETFQAKAFGLACVFTTTRSTLFYFDDITVRELRDDEQSGNPIIEGAEAGDVIINEVMFNPPTGGDEYVEIYNNSQKTIDLRSISIATRKASDGSLNKLYVLSESEQLLEPEQYAVVTEHRDLVCSFFNCIDDALFLELPVVPALNNESGCIVLANNKSGEILDEFAYNENMHSEGVSNKKGISLERVDFNVPASEPSNWRSASSGSGFGTPGYKNSQQSDGSGINDIEIIYPEFTAGEYLIHYRLDQPGYRCRAMIYNMQGRAVSIVANNELLGAEGDLRWNGKGGSSRSLPSGVYIIYLEVYDMKGIVKKFKKPVIVR
ncbi:MAG: lamin tail domain-containing protein [Dysgonamonadaceae bacterium]|jgi:hypothetical protein|nr:lamin tail domain-containing protein [Dysgonamonadaceae bacterium]